MEIKFHNVIPVISTSTNKVIRWIIEIIGEEVINNNLKSGYVKLEVPVDNPKELSEYSKEEIQQLCFNAMYVNNVLDKLSKQINFEVPVVEETKPSIKI